MLCNSYMMEWYLMYAISQCTLQRQNIGMKSVRARWKNQLLFGDVSVNALLKALSPGCLFGCSAAEAYMLDRVTVLTRVGQVGI